MMRRLLLSLLMSSLLLATEAATATTTTATETNVKDGRMTVVLAPPRKSDDYYKSKFSEYVEFFVGFATKIKGKDNVIVILDDETYPTYKDRLPADIIIKDYIMDPWVRDQAPVIPSSGGYQFKLVAGLPSSDAEAIQSTFNKLMDKLTVKMTRATIRNDGGNVVDNNKDKAIISDQIIKDNPTYTKTSMKAKLKADIPQLMEVAIIPRDEPKLGHSDGQVMWINDSIVMTNAYTGSSQDFDLNAFNTELSDSFPTSTIKTLAYQPEDDVTPDGFYSACGIYVNSIVTDKYIYVPEYGAGYKDAEAVQQITDAINGQKTIVTVPAKSICKLGGSLRCMSFQLQGANADALVEAARKSKSASQLAINWSLLIFCVISVKFHHKF